MEDLLQAPVMVIGGGGPLQLDPELVERLGEYIEQGGTILFDGDGCGDLAGYKESILELCNRWFDGATLEKLPPTHIRTVSVRSPETSASNLAFNRREQAPQASPATGSGSGGGNRRDLFLTARYKLCSGEPDRGRMSRLRYRRSGKDRRMVIDRLRPFNQTLGLARAVRHQQGLLFVLLSVCSR